jgi:hypothetical protein
MQSTGTMPSIQSQEELDAKNLELPQIKKDIETSWLYFQDNIKRYNEFYAFVFKTALSNADTDKLALLGKPPIEFPILEAHISRLRGEFAKQQPMIDVHAAEGLTIGKVDDSYLKLLKVVEAHLKEVLFNSNTDEFTYDVYSDLLAGGFSVAKVSTEYVNEKSFMQKIVVERVFNPTLCGFDPLATASHKGDGRYCFELFPMTQEEFAAEFGPEKAKTFNFTRSIEGFNWTYKNTDEKIVLVGDYYVKRQKTVTLVRVVPNDITEETMTLADYNKMLKNWESIEQPPRILERRKSTTTTIDRYRICQNEILEHTETAYPMLPLIFVDGNSVMITDQTGGPVTQMTRPYVYQAKGAQRLMNFAGQTIGQELEDMPKQIYRVPIEGIPKQYEKIYQNPQLASTLVYHQNDPMQPEMRLDPPEVLPRMATPPLVNETFGGGQTLIQQILGNYDSILGVNDKQVSGVAIQQGALQSNAAAIPYLMGYIKGLQRIAEVIINIMPLIYKTPRSIPIQLPNGKRDYQVINAPYPKEDKQKKLLQKAQEAGMGLGNELPQEEDQDAETDEYENAIMFNYDPEDINVSIEPGVNSHIQKQVSFELLTAAMQASPTLAEFFNQQGLPVLLESLDLPGMEGLKEMAEQFQAQMQQMRAEAMKQPTDADKIAQAEINKAQMEAQSAHEKTQAQLAIEAAKLAIERERLEKERAELMLKAAEIGAKVNAEKEKTSAAVAKSSIDALIDVAKMHNDMHNQQSQNI